MVDEPDRGGRPDDPADEWTRGMREAAERHALFMRDRGALERYMDEARQARNAALARAVCALVRRLLRPWRG